MSRIAAVVLLVAPAALFFAWATGPLSGVLTIPAGMLAGYAVAHARVPSWLHHLARPRIACPTLPLRRLEYV